MDHDLFTTDLSAYKGCAVRRCSKCWHWYHCMTGDRLTRCDNCGAFFQHTPAMKKD
jgi:hypothetical protein